MDTYQHISRTAEACLSEDSPKGFTDSLKGFTGSPVKNRQNGFRGTLVKNRQKGVPGPPVKDSQEGVPGPPVKDSQEGVPGPPVKDSQEGVPGHPCWRREAVSRRRPGLCMMTVPVSTLGRWVQRRWRRKWRSAWGVCWLFGACPVSSSSVRCAAWSPLSLPTPT